MFFNEYFSVFNVNPNFKENIKKILCEYSKEKIYKIFNILKNTFEKKVNLIPNSLDLKLLPDLIVFIGDGSVDGHGALINNKPYVFFDLSALILNFNKYNIDLFVTHELRDYKSIDEILSTNYEYFKDCILSYFHKIVLDGYNKMCN